jgi:hypothetical protein
MRHSGRVLRPPGKAFPEGLLPDLWGFGAEKEPKPVAPPYRRSTAIGSTRQFPPPRPPDPLAGLIELIGKLFA